MELVKRDGLNGKVIGIIDNDNREIAITEKEWERLKRSMDRFLKMANTSRLVLK
jgi:hypothetical protein